MMSLLPPARHGLPAKVRPLLVAAPLLLAACAPELATLPAPTPLSDYQVAESLKAERGAWPEGNWWKAYGDPVLDGLIEEALAGAPDIRMADARLQSALAALQSAGALRLPDVTVGGELQGVRQSLNMGYPDEFKAFLPDGWHDRGRVYIQAGYDLDLFGRNKARIDAAGATAEAIRAEGEATRLTLSTAVAMAYANLVRLSADRAMALDAVRIRQDSVDLTARRVEAGLENEGAVADARSTLASAKATIAAIDGQISLVRNQIAALLGKGPDRGLEIALPEKPSLPAMTIPADLPANLVARRPDIAATKQQAVAAAAEIRVATADFYPNVNLGALVGLEALGIDDLIHGDSIIGQVGPSISLPLFARQRLMAKLNAAQSDYLYAISMYDKAVTGAFKEVADVLATERALEAEAVHAREASSQATKAWQIARARYEGGLSRFSDVLLAEDRLLSARRQVANLDARVFAQHVALVRALGGGYVTPDLSQKNETAND